MDESLDELNPAPSLLMGPGPINADPRVLRAMSAPLLGQFDPQFRRYMAQTSDLYRRVFQTSNRATLVVDGTARSAIEAALVSLIEPGDRVLVPVFGRFGHLKVEIAKRCGAVVRAVEIKWGKVFEPPQLEREENVLCNRSNWPQFEYYGFQSTPGTLTWDQLKIQVDHRQPVAVAVGFKQRGGGHMGVVAGYAELEGGERLVLLVDPDGHHSGVWNLFDEIWGDSSEIWTHWRDYYDIRPLP